MGVKEAQLSVGARDTNIMSVRRVQKGFRTAGLRERTKMRTIIINLEDTDREISWNCVSG